MINTSLVLYITKNNIQEFVLVRLFNVDSCRAQSSGTEHCEGAAANTQAGDVLIMGSSVGHWTGKEKVIVV